MSGNSDLIVLVLSLFLAILVFLRWNDKKNSKKSSRPKKDFTSRRHSLSNSNMTAESPITDNQNDEFISRQGQDATDSTKESTGVKNKNVVSIEDVDRLVEYKIFKESGYFSQAAEVLSALIDSERKYREESYLTELANLYITIEEINKLAELLENYALFLDQDSLKGIIVKGFEVEPTNYRLQLVCSKILKQNPSELGAVIQKN